MVPLRPASERDKMKYSDGQEVRLGDRVKLGEDDQGVVVCSIDTNEFSEKHPKGVETVFKRGVVIEFPKWGIIHYEEAEDDLYLVSRA